MGNRLEFHADLAPSAPRRAASIVRTGLACLIAAAVALTPLAATAQTTLLRSELAGVIFPIPSNLWVPDAARTQAAALDQASASAGLACGATEFHIWFAILAERETILTRTNTAFAEAGWSLAVIDLGEEEGDRAYVATRGDDELVMRWLPLSESIGLVLCVVTGPRAEDAGPEAIADPAVQVIPLPVPRPDPNAPVIVEPALPEEPPAEVPAGEPDAIGNLIAGGETPEAPAEPAAAEPEPALAETNEPAPEPERAEPTTLPAGFDAAGEPLASPVLFLLAMALGVAAFFTMRWGRSDPRAVSGAEWPTALATVIYTEVAVETRRNRRGKEAVRYIPVVAYEYEVDGETYQAARLRFGDSSQPSMEAATRTIEQFPVGAGIEVRYDPKAPNEAAVEVDPDRLEFRLIAGIALSVLALAALIIAFS